MSGQRESQADFKANCSPLCALPHRTKNTSYNRLIAAMLCVAACSCHAHRLDLDTLQHTDHTHQLQPDDSELLHGCHGAIPVVQEVQVSAWLKHVQQCSTTSSSTPTADCSCYLATELVGKTHTVSTWCSSTPAVASACPHCMYTLLPCIITFRVHQTANQRFHGSR